MKKKRVHSLAHRLRQRAVVLTLAASSFPAFAASFDCTRALQPDERAICASRALSEMDVEMSVRFQMLTGLVAMGTRGDMGEAQQAWLKKRHACGTDRICLQTAYRDRIQTLKDEYAQLASRGPF